MGRRSRRCVRSARCRSSAGGWLVAGACSAVAAASADAQGAGHQCLAGTLCLAQRGIDGGRCIAGATAAGVRYSVGSLCVGGVAAGRRHHGTALVHRASLRRIGAAGGPPPVAALGRRACPSRARECSRSRERRGRQSEPGCGAHRDGGELSRLSDAMAGRGAARTAVCAHRHRQWRWRDGLVHAGVRTGCGPRAGRPAPGHATDKPATAGPQPSRSGIDRAQHHRSGQRFPAGWPACARAIRRHRDLRE